MNQSDLKNLAPEKEPAPPEAGEKVLVHVCCAVCSGSIIESVQNAGIDLSLYFYNPNIHPAEEYERRKAEVIGYARKKNIPFTDADYDFTRWLEITQGHENDPERGKRCSLCFEMRLIKTAEYAYTHGFPVFTTTLGISRQKDFDQVTGCGKKAARLFPGLRYWEYNWRKKDGSKRMSEITREENFYRQNYCGCRYSLRETRSREASRESSELRSKAHAFPAEGSETVGF